jgi:hypothetical protein
MLAQFLHLGIELRNRNGNVCSVIKRSIIRNNTVITQAQKFAPVYVPIQRIESERFNGLKDTLFNEGFDTRHLNVFTERQRVL